MHNAFTPMQGQVGGMGFPPRGPAGPFGYEKPFPVVRLRGLPFTATEYDIYEFFQGLEPVDVVLVRRDSRNTGEAYVLFGTAMQMDFALQKNRHSMGRRYVEVFRAKKQDYYGAVATFVADPPPQAFPENADEQGVPVNPIPQQQPGRGPGGPMLPPQMPQGVSPPPMRTEQQSEHTGVLKMRGLPFSATKDDIITFFDDRSFDISPLVHDSIHIVTSMEGRPTGVAFVEFASAEDAKTAMRKDRHTMGNRYVELFASSREEATRAATNAR